MHIISIVNACHTIPLPLPIHTIQLQGNAYHYQCIACNGKAMHTISIAFAYHCQCIPYYCQCIPYDGKAMHGIPCITQMVYDTIQGNGMVWYAMARLCIPYHTIPLPIHIIPMPMHTMQLQGNAYHCQCQCIQ
jgi:hypothetical protein